MPTLAEVRAQLTGPGGMFAVGAAYGAGIGAFTGWLIDRLHKSKPRVTPVVACW